MISVRVKEMENIPNRIGNAQVIVLNASANRLAQKIYKDLNKRELKCPVCGSNSGSVIINSGQEMTFAKTGFCHPEFAESFFFLNQ